MEHSKEIKEGEDAEEDEKEIQKGRKERGIVVLVGNKERRRY